MGIFNIFKALRGEPIFAQCPHRFHGSARKMGMVLIEAWKVYCEQHPQFSPNYQSESIRLETSDALYQVCLKVGYPDEWARSLATNQRYLGDLSYQLLCSDLLSTNYSLKKQARAVFELHQCFSEYLPDQLGDLRTQYESCKMCFD